MDLTPREIQERQFHDVFRGYNHEEVDVFLDEVAEAFERIYRENQSFHHRLRDLEEQLKTARATEDMLKRTLITAQKTAEEAVDEARSRAQGLVVEAEKKSAEIVTAAQARAKKIIDDAKGKEVDLETKLEGLRRFEQEYRTRLNAFIESQLQVLAEGPMPPGAPKPAAEAPAVQPEPPPKPAPPQTAKAPPVQAPAAKESSGPAPFVARPPQHPATRSAPASQPPSKPQPKPQPAPAGESQKPAAAGVPRANGGAHGGEGAQKTQQSNGGHGTKPQTPAEAAAPAKPGSDPARPPMTSIPKPPVVPAQRERASQAAPQEEELDEESIRKLFWGEE